MRPFSICIFTPAAIRAPLLAAVLTVLVPQCVHAVPLVSNIDQPTRAASTIQQDPDLLASPPVDLPWAAQSFTTDGESARLLSIEVLLGRRVGTPMVVAELRADAGAAGPGALVDTLSLGAIGTGAPGSVDLLPSTAVTLAPATTYWLVLGALGVGSYAFEYAEGNAATGPGSLGSYGYSVDRGASWIGFGGDNPYKLRVDVARTQVDAPAMPGAMALGVLSLVLVRRRRAGDRARAGGRLS
jgi:hypothetical protein